MSEIKGQLLGLVLVLAIFGVVGTAMVGIFKTTTDDLKTRVEAADEWDGSSTSGSRQRQPCLRRHRPLGRVIFE